MDNQFYQIKPIETSQRSTYSAKVLSVDGGGNFSNDKPFVILAFGTWAKDYLSYVDLFSSLPVGVDLTGVEVPAGELVATQDLATKLLILERNNY